MAQPILTEGEVRVFLMDRAELNPLIAGIRWSPEQIDQAMTNTVDFFNMLRPPTRIMYTVEEFPFRYLLLVGTAGYLLKSASINEAANQFSYSADGVQVNDKDKSQVFASLGTAFWNEFKELASDIKISQNVAEAYGTKHSEYVYRRR